MTREDEITRIATLEYAPKSDCFNAFIKGAEYADRTMLDRACEWLKNGGYFVNSNETIEDFRKAMEGGAE